MALVPIKDRWFWAFVALVVADATAGAAWIAGVGERARTRIVRVGPEELASPRDPLVVCFSRAMVEPGQLGAISPVPQALVAPALQLLGLWRDDRTLELRPLAPFPAASECELRFPGGLVDREGRTVDAGRAWKFRTPPFRLVEARQVALTREWEATIDLTFNDEVALADLDRAVRFSDEKGRPVVLERTTGGDAARRVAFRSDPRRRERIDVSLDAGLRGVSGPLGLESPVRRSVAIDPGLGLTEVTATSRDEEDGTLDLHLALRVDPRVARDFIRVEPSVPYEVQPGPDGLRLRGRFRPGERYRLHLRGGLPAEGGRFLPDDAVRTVRVPDLSPEVGWVGEGRFLRRAGSLTLLARSVNVGSLLVDIERVRPANIVHHLHGDGHVLTPVVKRKRVPLGGARNRPLLTRLDLAELLGGDPGCVERGPYRIALHSEEERWSWAETTVTVTDLGVHVKTSPAGLLVWAVRMDGLAPAAGASVTVLSRSGAELVAGSTDGDGLVRFAAHLEGDEEPFAVSVSTPDDFTYVPLEEAGLPAAGLEVGGRPYPGAAGEAFVYAERGVIRPGERLHLRALVRDAGGRLPAPGMPLRWEVLKPGGRSATSAPASLSDLGTAELEWASDAALPTGHYTARLAVPGPGGPVLGETSFRLEEFLPQTLRVKVEAEERRFAAPGPLAVTVRAENLFGGPAAGLAVRARCELRPSAFALPAWPGVAFGATRGTQAEAKIEAQPAALDAEGRTTVVFDLPDGLSFPGEAQAVVTASVVDGSGRACTSGLVRAVDPRPFYLGVRRPEGGARLGEPWRAEVIAVRPDGSPVDLDRLEARVVRITWTHSLQRGSRGEYRWTSERVETPLVTRPVACAGGRGRFDFTPEEGGEHVLVVEGTREGITASVEATFFADYSGGGDAEVGASLEVPSRIALVPDRPHYRAGETARVRVESPIAGLALLALESDRVHLARTLRLEEAHTVLDVPVPADLLPHGYLTLTVVRSLDAPGSRAVPVRAYGAVALPIDPAGREARVSLALPAEVRPGKELRVDLDVRRADGSPEEAEAAVALVDAGILALVGSPVPDPLAFFTARRALGTRAADTFSLIVPEPGDLLAGALPAPGGDGDGALAGLLSPVASRRVKPVSLWLGGLRTGPDGRASHTLVAPDFDGELTAIAVVSGKTGVGSARAEVKVRRPLVISPGLPRFAAPGDRFRVPVALHNTTGAEIAASVRASATGSLALAPGETAERPIAVAAGGRAVLAFMLEAREAGASEVAFAVTAAGEETAVRTEVPVRPAAPPVVRAGCLRVEPGKPLAIETGADLLAGTAAGELVLSTSVLPSLEGSLRYLLHYPYGCVEQTASSLLPWVALGDYLRATDPAARCSSPSGSAEVRDFVDAGVERLFRMQAPDGGLGWWPGDTKSYAWGSLHAAFAIEEARAAGFAVPEERWGQLVDFIDRLLSDPREEDEARAATVRAFALEVLARAGRTRPGWIEALYARRDELTEEGRAHLALAAAHARCPLPGALLSAKGMDAAPGTSTGTGTGTGTGHGDTTIEAARDLTGILYSRPREMSVVVSALVDLGEARETVLPLLLDLVRQCEGGRWRSTQEDALFVLAVSKASRLFPPASGPARVTVEAAGEATRTVEVVGRTSLKLPAAASVRLAAEGAPVFAFWEMRGVPKAGVGEEEKGISIERVLRGADGRPVRDGPLHQGDRVVVEIEVRAGRGLPNLVVVDPLPAGLEIENPDLLGSDGKLTAQGFSDCRTQVRDDRFILFADARAGTSTYSYVARAVTAGRFAVPPVAVECMYDSGIRATKGAGTLEVLPFEK